MQEWQICAYLFPPTDNAFKQHIRRVDYPVAVSIHSHEAKPDLWNPDGNGWQLRNMRLESVMFERDTAPKEVRDLTHLYCIDEDCPLARTCQCLNEKLTCTEFCSCNYCDECSNRDHSLCLTIAVTMKMTDLWPANVHHVMKFYHCFMKITIEYMHMFILVHLYAHMSVFLVWFNIRVVENSYNNNLFVTNV